MSTMRAINKAMMAAAMVVATATSASAQYYQMADQAMNMIGQIFSGDAYRGTLDVSYLTGVGSHRANITEITTTQGVQYRSWFFMGLGAGVDLLNTSNDVDDDSFVTSDKKLSTNGVMIPLYSDFRFLIGPAGGTRGFVDLRLGGAFLVGKNYLRVDDGYLTRSESFYLKPSVGVRVPLTSKNPKLAMNVGVSYMLLTNGYWYGNSSTVALSSVGATVQFEW